MTDSIASDALKRAESDLNHLASKYDEQEFVAPTICKIRAALTPNASVPAELVERVARALHAHEWKGQPEPDNFAEGRDYWMSSARAAIAALPPAGRVEEMREARWAKWPNGDAGDALDYALDHIEDAFERTDFLECWRQSSGKGDMGEWPKYYRWLDVQRDGARAAPGEER